jgi:hypothetical protein
MATLWLLCTLSAIFAQGEIAFDAKPVVAANEDRVNFAALGDGNVVGRLKLTKPWRDFRAREVPPGEYVLRYRIQPKLKDHAGTSAYRDFLILEPSPDGHPFVMALVPPSEAPGVVVAEVAGMRVGVVVEGTGNLDP